MSSLICHKCKNGIMIWKVKDTLMICKNCGHENTIQSWNDEWTEKSPQNLPKADAYSLLADVRTEIYKLKFKSDIIEKSEKVGEGQLLKNYNNGLMDALEIFNKKVSEHFIFSSVI